MARVVFLALVLAVLCFGYVAADGDICDEAQFWKALVTHKVSAAQLTSCHEVVSIVTFAREARCMQLVPATVCSYAQQYCPGIECSVQFTLADDFETDEDTPIDEDTIDIDADTEEFVDTDEDLEEELTDEFKKHDTNTTKKEEKAQKKADKKALKEQKKEQKRAEHEEAKAAHEQKKAEEKAEHEQKKQQEKAEHDAKKAAHEQKKADRHQREAAKHNATSKHHHRKANATKPVSALADWEVLDAEEVDEVVALDTETMTTNKVPQRGPRPAPVVLIMGIMLVAVAVVGMTAFRQKTRREGYRTLPDSGYL